MSIQNMRDRSEGIVAKIIVGLIIIVFAAFGMGSITTFLAPVAKVATVNGVDVTQQEMDIEVARSRRIMLSQDQDPANLDEDKLRREVLQNLINRKLLIQASEELGMAYSDSNIDADILANQAFQIDGMFNPQQFKLVLGSAGYQPVLYRKEMRRDRMFMQLNSAIRGSAFVIDSELRRANSLAQQTRDIAFLRVDVKKLSETQEVNDAEIEAYYNNNPLEFMTEESVDIAYLELNQSDFMDKVEVTDEQLEMFYAETKAIYAQAERRRVAHILIEVSDQVSAEQAKQEIDGIYEKLIAGGDFAALAKEHSIDTGSAELGGDLGFNDADTFVEEFELAASTLSLNQISKPVKTEFGYHLLKLLDIEAAVEPDLDDVLARVELAFREREAEELFVNQSSKLSESSYESMDLEEPAEAFGLEIKTTGHIVRGVTTGIAASPGVIDAALSADVLVNGNNSELLEISPNHHIVVRINEYQAQEVKPLALVAEQISKNLALAKATNIARQQAEEMTAMLESGSITRYVADQYDLTWTVVGEATRNQLDMDREISQKAFSLPRPADDDKSVAYTVLSNGDAVVLSVTNVNNKMQDDVLAEDLMSLASVLSTQQGYSDYREFIDNLAPQGSIKIVQ